MNWGVGFPLIFPSRPGLLILLVWPVLVHQQDCDVFSYFFFLPRLDVLYFFFFHGGCEVGGENKDEYVDEGV